jgi:hypothetical protein
VTLVRGRIELKAKATPGEKLVIEQLDTINKRLSDLERPGRLPKALAPSMNVRITIDDDQLSPEDFDRVSGILVQDLDASYIKRRPNTVWANAPRLMLVDQERWASTRVKLLAIPGVRSVENRYERD